MRRSELEPKAEASEEGPAPGGTQTSIRTLEPLPQQPTTP